MSNQIRKDALNIRKLVREAEALSDEAMIACARLKQAMISARQNPEIPVDTGQRAILRLSEAERQAVSMSSNLLRVHDELSQVARERAGLQSDIPTDIKPSALVTDTPVSEAV